MLYRRAHGEGSSPETSTLCLENVMATGRDKDRKTRRKHRKNVARKKALAKARRGKKGKKG